MPFCCCHFAILQVESFSILLFCYFLIQSFLYFYIYIFIFFFLWFFYIFRWSPQNQPCRREYLGHDNGRDEKKLDHPVDSFRTDQSRSELLNTDVVYRFLLGSVILTRFALFYRPLSHIESHSLVPTASISSETRNYSRTGFGPSLGFFFFHSNPTRQRSVALPMFDWTRPNRAIGSRRLAEI